MHRKRAGIADISGVCRSPHLRRNSEAHNRAGRRIPSAGKVSGRWSSDKMEQLNSVIPVGSVGHRVKTLNHTSAAAKQDATNVTVYPVMCSDNCRGDRRRGAWQTSSRRYLVTRSPHEWMFLAIGRTSAHSRKPPVSQGFMDTVRPTVAAGGRYA